MALARSHQFDRRRKVKKLIWLTPTNVVQRLADENVGKEQMIIQNQMCKQMQPDVHQFYPQVVETRSLAQPCQNVLPLQLQHPRSKPSPCGAAYMGSKL